MVARFIRGSQRLNRRVVSITWDADANAGTGQSEGSKNHPLDAVKWRRAHQSGQALTYVHFEDERTSVLLVGLIPASLEPVFEIDEGGGPLIVVGAMEGVLVERLDPVILGAGTSELILRVGVAEIRCSVGKHIPRADRIRCVLAI